MNSPNQASHGALNLTPHPLVEAPREASFFSIPRAVASLYGRRFPPKPPAERTPPPGISPGRSRRPAEFRGRLFFPNQTGACA